MGSARGRRFRRKADSEILAYSPDAFDRFLEFVTLRANAPIDSDGDGC